MFKEHSLFPRNHEELAAASFKSVLQTLERVRTARYHLYRLEPAKRHRNVSEIDTAISELKILYRLAVENQKR